MKLMTLNKLLIAGWILSVLGILVLTGCPSTESSLVTSGEFICFMNGKIIIHWDTSKATYLYDNKWLVRNPDIHKDVMYHQSQFESCTVLPVVKEENEKQESEESLNIEHKKDKYEVSK